MTLRVTGALRADALETTLVDASGVSQGFFVFVSGGTLTLPAAGSAVPLGRLLGILNFSTSTMTTLLRDVNTINGLTQNFSLGRRSFALCIATANQQWLVTQLGDIAGYRSVTANANVTLVESDAMVELASTTSGIKTITMATASAGLYAGRRVRFVLTIRTNGSYTVPVVRGTTSGTVTMANVGQGVDVVFDGSSWKLFQLLGGATFA